MKRVIFLGISAVSVGILSSFVETKEKETSCVVTHIMLKRYPCGDVYLGQYHDIDPDNNCDPSTVYHITNEPGSEVCTHDHDAGPE